MDHGKGARPSRRILLSIAGLSFLTNVVPDGHIRASQDQCLGNRFFAVATRQVQSRLPVFGRLVHRGTVAEQTERGRNVSVAAGG